MPADGMIAAAEMGTSARSRWQLVIMLSCLALMRKGETAEQRRHLDVAFRAGIFRSYISGVGTNTISKGVGPVHVPPRSIKIHRARAPSTKPFAYGANCSEGKVVKPDLCAEVVSALNEFLHNECSDKYDHGRNISDCTEGMTCSLLYKPLRPADRSGEIIESLYAQHTQRK